MIIRGTDRLAAACGSALVGALCGAVLAAFGNSISGSTLAVGAVIILCTGLGAWGGRWAGAVTGAFLGALATAFGHLVGGTALGVALTILACAALGGWLRWAHESRARGGEPAPAARGLWVRKPLWRRRWQGDAIPPALERRVCQ